jgi:hypothetical protein
MQPSKASTGGRTRKKIARALRTLAYHEAGHAVVAWVCGVRVKKVTIVPDERSLGHVVHQGFAVCLETDCWDWEDWEALMYCDREPKGTPSVKEIKRNREKEIMILMAGGIAARRYDPHCHDDYSCGDQGRSLS